MKIKDIQDKKRKRDEDYNRQRIRLQETIKKEQMIKKMKFYHEKTKDLQGILQDLIQNGINGMKNPGEYFTTYFGSDPSYFENIWNDVGAAVSNGTILTNALSNMMIGSLSVRYGNLLYLARSDKECHWNEYGNNTRLELSDGISITQDYLMEHMTKVLKYIDEIRRSVREQAAMK